MLSAEGRRGDHFALGVKNPHDFGVVEFDKNNNVISLEVKTAQPLNLITR